MAQREVGEPPAARHIAALAAAPEISRHAVAAAVGLAIAGASAPITVSAIGAAGGLLGPPLIAGALVGLLVLAPSTVGLTAALTGLRSVVAALAAEGGADAELAVLRVFLDTLAFLYALGLAALTATAEQAPAYVPVAALALVAAWAVLLWVILRPAAPRWRRFAAMGLDAALFSAFLHFGGSAVAGWYPLYLLAIFYAGWRFGRGALVMTALGSIAGFAAVVLSTASWRQQPALAAGLLAALGVLPAFAAAVLRALKAAREAAQGAEAEGRSLLLLIADALHRPPAADAAPIDDVLDFAAIEAGRFAAPVESFDLRALVRQRLMPLQARAAERRVALRWRVDPLLPRRLRGRARAFARVLVGLAEQAIESAAAGSVGIVLDAVGSEPRRVLLRLRVEGGDGDAAAGLALRLVRRLVGLLGGKLVLDRPGGQRVRLVVTLPLAIEDATAEPALDLGGRAVLIATEDGRFAEDVAGAASAWNAEVCWVGDADAVLAELDRRGAGERPGQRARERPVVIIDGRGRLLPALGLAGRVAHNGSDAPFILLVADDNQLAAVAELDAGQLDGLIPAPLTAPLLANALAVLPLGSEQPAPPPAGERPGADMVDGRITPIAAHPKFVAETRAAVDAQAIDRLCALAGGPDFVHEVIETFRGDARRIMAGVEQAVAAADTAGFARSLDALRRAARHLGGTRLCELLGSLQGLGADELRGQGAIHIQRLDAEIDGLARLLREHLPASEAARP